MSLSRPDPMESRRALSTIGTGGATIISAQGFGTQKGHSETYRGASYEVDTKPKTMFQVACKDDDVENIIEPCEKSQIPVR